MKGLLMAQNTSDFELQVEDPGIHTRGPPVPSYKVRHVPQRMYRKQTLRDKRMLKEIMQEKKKELKAKCTGK